MNCINCGASLTDMDYCPHCGCDVMVQKKACYLANLYYNQGLEKASIRDLSGAISCLRRSLTFNKNHIQARNLLGLVYFETGEVVSALSEWVISKNLQPRANLAENYIKILQANPNKLDSISESIRKYNHALGYCLEKHEDMAMIQLKKVLAQNPKLIKGYHLLALLQIRERSFGKARRTLKKAAKIDRTNTTTLRFLREIDEQTGTNTNLERRSRIAEDRRVRGLSYHSGNDLVIQPPALRESSVITGALTFFLGLALGAAALWFLVVPAKTQQIHQKANGQVQEYSDAITSKEAELESLRTEIKAAQAASQEQDTLQQAAQATMTSFDELLTAFQLSYAETPDRDAVLQALAKINREVLTESAKGIYDGVRSRFDFTDDELAQFGTADSQTAEPAADEDGGDYDTDGGYDDYSGDYEEDGGYGEEY